MCLIFDSTDKVRSDTLQFVDISNMIFETVHQMPVKSYFMLT